MPAAGGCVVASSGRGDCGFQLPKGFLNLVLLGGGGLGKLAEALLDNAVAVCCGDGQVFEVGVKISRQVGTIRETREGAARQRMERDCIGVNVV